MAARDLDDSGLRERKKAQTRQDLRAAAAKLFKAYGFEGTTIADIAAAANVSERTFFRYFDSKSALLLPDVAELFDLVETALAGRPADEEPLAAVCAALLSAAEPFGTTSLTALARPLDVTEPLVAGQLARASVEFEDRLALLVRDRLPADTPEADLHSAVVAGAALSAVRAVLRTQRARRCAGTDLDGPPARLLPVAFDILFRLGPAV